MDHEPFIRQWHHQRGIPVSKEKAIMKAMEEFGEVAGANFQGDPELMQDALGDVYVTLVGIAMAYDLTLEECIQKAWGEIKDRSGTVQGGVFQKDE